jgi:hypothetical protein
LFSSEDDLSALVGVEEEEEEEDEADGAATALPYPNASSLRCMVAPGANQLPGEDMCLLQRLQISYGKEEVVSVS